MNPSLTHNRYNACTFALAAKPRHLRNRTFVEQVEQFSRQLRPHQMAMLPDGTTVLARAVIEHNLAAASRLYTCIYFDQLGALLGVPESAAETTAARMVQEDRLKVRGQRRTGLHHEWHQRPTAVLVSGQWSS